MTDSRVTWQLLPFLHSSTLGQQRHQKSIKNNDRLSHWVSTEIFISNRWYVSSVTFPPIRTFLCNPHFFLFQIREWFHLPTHSRKVQFKVFCLRMLQTCIMQMNSCRHLEHEVASWKRTESSSFCSIFFPGDNKPIWMHAEEKEENKVCQQYYLFNHSF